MHKEPIQLVKHIRDECFYIQTVVNTNVTKERFLADETLKRAIVRSLEIKGEASKNIPGDFKIKWDSIPWKYMAGMRDRLIHDYMGVNYSIVWDVMINKIPELRLQIMEVIDES